eukprot:Skav218041  [mRNA]  locus=scaffold214:640892:642988:+ [translate_table: standard]
MRRVRLRRSEWAQARRHLSRWLREIFWARYKVVFPPEFTPSDRLLTKAQRALTKRSLEVADLWQVRSIANQRMATQKRRKVGANLYYGGEPDEADAEITMSWHSYLVQLRLYLLALAMAGAKKLEPPPTEVESATTESISYVEVPYDIVLKYYCRAESWAMRSSGGNLLARLESLDKAERAEWAHRLATSSETLGSIIARVFRDRDSHWTALVVSDAPEGCEDPRVSTDELHREDCTLKHTSFPRFVDKLTSEWKSPAAADDVPALPVFLDLLSGPNYPLSVAFKWAGWNVLQPVDFALGSQFDITLDSTQQAIADALPTVSLVSCAMDCSTKSKIRDIPLAGRNAPKPLRSVDHPRGRPGLPSALQERVRQDNLCSDFVLAVQYVMNRNQRGALRENPRNSHHWIDPVEQFVTPSSTGDSDWGVWDYDACCLFASRRKKQRIVHNIEHMRLLPNLVCGHVHSQDEWKPELQANGRYYYPSKEEAEYTAHLCFTIVAACSHWAVSKGLAVHKITRLPPMQTAGDWRPLLSLDSEVFRKQAMPASAAFLGLTVLVDAPKRVQVHSCWTPQSGLPVDTIYIGHGHFSHRLACTKWENPFLEGRDG